MATQLAQRSSTLGSTAATQKRAAAPRAPFSSPVLAQLKQVRPCIAQQLHFLLSATHNRAKAGCLVFTQNAKAVAAAQQPVAQRSVKAQVRAATRPNAGAQQQL